MLSGSNSALIELSSRLYQNAKAIRLLSHVAWPNSIKDDFFASKGESLPVVEYASFQGKEILLVCDEIARLTESSPATLWLQRQAHAIEASVRLLENTQKPEFVKYSHDLFGSPYDVLSKVSVLQLAKNLKSSLHYFQNCDQLLGLSTSLPEEEARDRIHKAVVKLFGDDAPEVILTDNLAANATASLQRIKLRKGARFSERFVKQLIHHEAEIHVATSLNGAAQQHLDLLALSHGGTTRTQEGLAVFAEFISGTMGIRRMQRLADRVIAIAMAQDGADFIEVYRYFLNTVEADQAYENTRRVFRGGVITGGAPFTKDLSYLAGLMEVHRFLQQLVIEENIHLLPVLFCGKLSIKDVKDLHWMQQNGLCDKAKYLPEWIKDQRFLLSYLAYSGFISGLELLPDPQR